MKTTTAPALALTLLAGLATPAPTRAQDSPPAGTVAYSDVVPVACLDKNRPMEWVPGAGNQAAFEFKCDVVEASAPVYHRPTYRGYEKDVFEAYRRRRQEPPEKLAAHYVIQNETETISETIRKQVPNPKVAKVIRGEETRKQPRWEYVLPR